MEKIYLYAENTVRKGTICGNDDLIECRKSRDMLTSTQVPASGSTPYQGWLHKPARGCFYTGGER